MPRWLSNRLGDDHGQVVFGGETTDLGIDVPGEISQELIAGQRAALEKLFAPAGDVQGLVVGESHFNAVGEDDEPVAGLEGDAAVAVGVAGEDAEQAAV